MSPGVRWICFGMRFFFSSISQEIVVQNPIPQMTQNSLMMVDHTKFVKILIWVVFAGQKKIEKRRKLCAVFPHLGVISHLFLSWPKGVVSGRGSFVGCLVRKFRRHFAFHFKYTLIYVAPWGKHKHVICTFLAVFLLGFFPATF